MCAKHHLLTVGETVGRIDDYMMNYYYKEGIQEKLGYLTPIEYGQKVT